MATPSARPLIITTIVCFFLTFLQSALNSMQTPSPQSGEGNSSNAFQNLFESHFSRNSPTDQAIELLNNTPGTHFSAPSSELTFSDIRTITPPSTLEQLELLFATLKAYNPTATNNTFSIPVFTLFHGPAGVGKTTVPEILAHELGWNLCTIKAPNLQTEFIGSGSKNIEQIFNLLPMLSKPTVLLFDEIDSLCSEQKKSENDDFQRSVRSLWIALDANTKAKNNNKIITIGTTNSPEKITKLLADRITENCKIEFSKPLASQRHALITAKSLALGIYFEDSLQKYYAKRTHDWNVRSIIRFLNSANKLTLLSSNPSKNDAGMLIISQDVLKKAYAEEASRVIYSPGWTDYLKEKIAPHATAIILSTLQTAANLYMYKESLDQQRTLQLAAIAAQKQQAKDYYSRRI